MPAKISFCRRSVVIFPSSNKSNFADYCALSITKQNRSKCKFDDK